MRFLLLFNTKNNKNFTDIKKGLLRPFFYTLCTLFFRLNNIKNDSSPKTVPTKNETLPSLPSVALQAQFPDIKAAKDANCKNANAKNFKINLIIVCVYVLLKNKDTIFF